MAGAATLPPPLVDVPVSQPNPISRDTYPEPLLVPAIEEDISTFAQITVNAARTDLSVLVSRESPTAYHEEVVGFIKTRFSSPSWAFVKALDPSNHDKIIGWGSTNIFEADWANEVAASEASEKKEDKKQKLHDFIAAYEEGVQKKWFAGKRYLYLMAIFVEPSYQGFGVGSSIMDWVEERADRDGVVGYLQNFAGARGFYEARGWNTIDGIEVDLREWVKSKEKGGGLGYGTYRTGYMIRLPAEKTLQLALRPSPEP